MTLWILDTDQLTLFLHGNPSICQRVASVSPMELAVTIVTQLSQLKKYWLAGMPSYVVLVATTSWFEPIMITYGTIDERDAFTPFDGKSAQQIATIA